MNKKIMIGDYCSFILGGRKTGVCVGYDKCKPVMLLEDNSYMTIPVPRFVNVRFLGKKEVTSDAMDNYVPLHIRYRRHIAQESSGLPTDSDDSEELFIIIKSR